MESVSLVIEINFYWRKEDLSNLAEAEKQKRKSLTFKKDQFY